MNQGLDIELFGYLRTTAGSERISHFRTRKAGVLLGYLACFLNCPHAREELIELLWPDSDRDAGRMSLRSALTAIHRLAWPLPEYC